MKKYSMLFILCILIMSDYARAEEAKPRAILNQSNMVLIPGLRNNSEVVKIQKKLGVSATGNYLAKTIEAVKKLQEKNVLPVTGVVDVETRKVIDSIIDATKISPVVVDTKWDALCKDGQPHVQVLSPNGGESYIVGQQMNVKWKSCNIASPSIASLNLGNFGISAYPSGIGPTLSPLNLAFPLHPFDKQTTQNDGTEIFTIPINNPNVLPGNKYKVVVFLGTSTVSPADLAGSNWTWSTSDDSDNYFSIVEKGTVFDNTIKDKTSMKVTKETVPPISKVCNSAAVPFIEVLSPSGNTHHYGDVMNIKVRTCKVSHDDLFAISIKNPTQVATYPLGLPVGNVLFGSAPASLHYTYCGLACPEGYFEFGFKVPSTTGGGGNTPIFPGSNTYSLLVRSMAPQQISGVSSNFSILP